MGCCFTAFLFIVGIIAAVSLIVNGISGMSTTISREQIETLNRNILSIQRLTVDCANVARALIEIGESLTPRVFSWNGNEYTRANGNLLRLFEETRTLLRRMRRSTLNADFIRTEKVIRDLNNCCLTCLHHNTERLKNKQLFECLIVKRFNRINFIYRNSRGQRTQSGDSNDGSSNKTRPNKTPLRFSIDERGNIIERN